MFGCGTAFLRFSELATMKKAVKRLNYTYSINKTTTYTVTNANSFKNEFLTFRTPFSHTLLPENISNDTCRERLSEHSVCMARQNDASRQNLCDRKTDGNFTSVCISVFKLCQKQPSILRVLLNQL